MLNVVTVIRRTQILMATSSYFPTESFGLTENMSIKLSRINFFIQQPINAPRNGLKVDNSLYYVSFVDTFINLPHIRDKWREVSSVSHHPFTFFF